MMTDMSQIQYQPFGDPNIDSFLAIWGLDSKCKEVLESLDTQTQQRVMSGFQPTNMDRANQMFMGFVQSVSGKSGGAPSAQQAFSSGPPVITGNAETDGFVQRWGLDGKSQEVLLGLDPVMQHRVMSEFSPTNMSRANQMFMGFVKSVAGMGGPMGASTALQTPSVTGNPQIDGFVAQWGLDGKAQDLLCSLDPGIQQRVMGDFKPTNISRANQMFMGFVKSVTGSSEARAPRPDSFGNILAAPVSTGNPAIDGFVAQWGLDSKAQDLLCSLDPGTQQRVMSDFQPTNIARANQMFMGFVKSVAGKSGAQTIRQAFEGGVIQSPVYTGNAAIDGFVMQWGLDGKSQEVLINLDPVVQQRVISDFQPPDISRANQIFMGFVKSVINRGGGGGGAPSAQQAFGAPPMQQASGDGLSGMFTSGVSIPPPVDFDLGPTGQTGQMLTLPTGDTNVDAFVAKWGLDQQGAETLLCLDPESQQRVMSGFNPADSLRANNIFMGFVKSVVGKSGVPTPQVSFGAPTSQQAIAASTSPQGFSESRFSDSPQGFSESRFSDSPQGFGESFGEAFSTPTEQQAVGDGTGMFNASSELDATSMFNAVGDGASMMAQSAPPVGDPGTEAFVAMWGLDQKCQHVLDTLNPATQQRVMSGFQPTDLSRANQMFMGFVKSIMAKGGGMASQQYPNNFMSGGETVKPKISAFLAQWGLDFKCQEVLSNLDPETQLRVMSGFKPSDPERASRMFMGFVKSIGGRGNRYIPY